MRYSFFTCGFYDPKTHIEIQDDSVEISKDLYRLLLEGQSNGQLIVKGSDGLPILIDPPPPAPLTREQIEAQRLRAYADPLVGSDRYFAEAQRESLMGNPEAAAAAKALGLARFAEIQAENPWPAE